MHAENGGVIDTLVKEALRRGEKAPKYHALTRPTRAEGEATGRAIALAEMAGVPIYIVHLSCSDALEKVKQARDMGLPAYAETCPQYLFLSYEDYERPGFEGAKYVMSPPLREKWNQDVLWKGLQQNDLQVVSTDHCPFCMNDAAQKQLGKDDFSKIPNGAPGIETRLMLAWDGGVRAGRIDAHRFVELMSTNPAKMFGLWPKKGTIAVGSDGDLVLWDPEKETTLSAATHHMRVDYNPYEGRVVKGAPAVVLSRGEVIVDHGKWLGATGRGQFVKRQAGRPLRRVSAGRHARHAPGARRPFRARPSSARPVALERGPRAHPDRAAHLGHLPHGVAVGRPLGLHPDLHAGGEPGGRRHELVAGDPDHHARQPDRVRADGADRARGDALRDPVPGARAGLVRRPRLERARDPARAGGLRLVRDPDLDRRPGDLHDAQGGDPRLGAALRDGPGLRRLLALEHVRGREGQRVDQVPRGLGGAVPDRRRPGALRLGGGASRRPRAHALGPEPVRDHRRVPGLLRPLAHRDGRLLGDARAQHPGPLALREGPEGAGPGASSSACRPR